MYKNYFPLRSGTNASLKERFGKVESPPASNLYRLWLFVIMMTLSFGQSSWAQSIANYTFSTSTTGSLEDISMGASSLLVGNNDSAASTVNALGFDFYFMGVKYTHFSINSNGQMQLHTSSTATAISSSSITSPSAGVALLAPMAGDNEVNNGASFKVLGTAPNRKLVVEWNQFYANWTPNLTNAGNMQVWLHETTGVVEYIYGEIYNASNSSVSKAIGIASGSTVTTAGYVTVGATPTFTAATSFTTNTFAAGSGTVTGSPLIANLGSAANGSRRVYSFTPINFTSPANPITLAYTNVSPIAMNVTWVDNSTNETFFTVTRALDAGFTTGLANFTVSSTTAAGTGTVYTLPQTGLVASTPYFYRIVALNEAAVPLAGLTGSSSTAAPGTLISIASGNWSSATTWDAGYAPTIYDNAVISTGHTVLSDATSQSAVNLTVDGTFGYGSTPTSFTVSGNLTVNSGGSVNVYNVTTGKTLIVRGNILNNGTINVSVGATTAGQLTLSGTTVQTVSGTGTFTTDVIRNLVFNNTSTAVPNINWQFNNIKIANNLDLTGAKINLGSNKMTFGNNAAGGTLTVPTGCGFLSGKFSRWWLATSTGSAIAIGADPTTVTSRYPFINASGFNRSMWISRTTATGAVAGELAVTYTDATTLSTGLTIADGAYTINERYNGNWAVSNEGTPVSASSYILAVVAQNAYTATNGNSRLMFAGAPLGGTHQTGTTTPGVQRIAVSQTDLLAAPLYIGVSTSEVAFASATNGDWNNPATWNKGIVPSCTDVVFINSGHTVTVNSALNVVKNLTINATGTLIVASGDLTVGCTLNNNALINNGTLTINGGTLTLNGRFDMNNGANLNQSGGSFIVDGNDAGIVANSVASGTPIFRIGNSTTNYSSGTIALTGGEIVIVDPHTATTNTNGYAYYVYFPTGFNIEAGAAHTFKFGNGISTEAGGHTSGFYADPYVGNGRLNFGNLIINNPSGTNRNVSLPFSFGIHGNLDVVSGSFAPAGGVILRGNLNVAGTYIETGGLVLAQPSALTSVVNTVAQSIGYTSTGVVKNLADTANLTGFVVNNSAGVTLNSPFSVSGTITLTAGVVNTTSVNVLTSGTATVAGTISGGSATAYVNGPLARTFATRTATGTYTSTTLFPVGKSGAYLPIHIDPTTTGVVVLTGEAYNSNAGTLGGGVVTLSTNRWEALVKSGNANFSGSFIRIADASTTATNKILQASAAAGSYASILPSTTFVAGTPNTLTTATQIAAVNFQGYFSSGDLNICPAPTTQPTALVVSNLGATAFNGSFTLAADTPSNYLIVRYPTGSVATNPVDFTSYTVNGALGLGTVAAVLTTPTNTFTQTGLVAGTVYDYYIYSYNNQSCYGPSYNTTTPLTATITTCATATTAPTLLTVSGLSNNGFTIGWTATATDALELDIATNSTFTTFLAGYNAKPLVAGTITEVVTGLTANTTYYVRLRAVNGTCYSLNSTTLTVTTECNAVTSFIENFDSVTTPTIPSCWGKVGTGGLANTQTTNSSSAPNCLYMYSSTSTSRAVVKMPPVSNAAANTHRLRFKLRGNSTAGETVEVGYLTDSNDAATFVPLQSLVASTLTYVEQIVVPGAIAGPNRVFAFRTGTLLYSVLIDDVSWEAIPTPVIANFTSTTVCGESTVVTINGTNFTGATVTVNGTSFTPSTITSTQIVVPVNVSTTGNIVVSTGGGTATSATPLTFTTSPALTLSATTGTICNGGDTLVTVTSGTVDYDTFVWSPTTGVTGNQTVGYTFNPSASTVYTLTASQSTGTCSRTATYAITVNVAPSTITVSPDAPTICEGGIQQLSASSANVQTSVVSGTGANTSGAGVATPALGPNPLQAYYGGTKQQWIYTAAELTALGLMANTQINSIKLDLATANTTYALNNVVVKMKNSSTGSFATATSWETGLTTVKAASTYTPVVGANTFTLDTPFAWNGTDNLVIEMNYSNSNGGNSVTYNTAKHSPTSFVSTIFYRVDSVPATTVDAYVGTASSTYSARTDVTFGLIFVPKVTWSSTGSADLFTDNLATIPYVAGSSALSVYAKPAATATYTATATIGTCTKTDTSVVTVTPTAVPNFAEIGTICSGSLAPTLATTSPNGVTGTWSPATVSNTANGTYVFTPTAGQCANAQTLNVVVTNVAAPTGDDTQSFNNTATVADLVATGDGIKWYDASTAGTLLTPATALTNGGVYYASQTVGGCESTARFQVTVTLVSTLVDYANIQFPGTQTINQGGSFDVYARVFDLGITEAAGANPAITAWIGYSSTNENPNAASFTWIPATYNVQAGNDDEYVASLGATLPVGTYYYASRFQVNGGAFSYGGYTPTGGGFWDGTINVNGVLTVQTPVITYANVQFPGTATITAGGTTDVYARVYAQGVTEAAGANSAVTAWIGYSSTNENPNAASFTWVPATYNVQVGNDDEYMLALGAGLPAGTYYYASRFQLTGGAFVYGGFSSTNGGFWDGTANVNGVLTVNCGVVNAPTGTAIQNFTTGQTLADFVVVGQNIIWYDAATNGNILPSTTVLVSGTNYYASQTVGGCESPTRLMVTAGVDLRTPEFDTASLKFYPNPVADVLTVTYSSAIESIEIFNVLGQRVYQKTHNAQEVKIDMSALATGNYIVNVTANGLVKNIKVIKK